MPYNLRIIENSPAASHTTLKVGGCIRKIIEPKSLAALAEYLSENTESYRVLGYGSNVVIGPKGIDETVIRLGRNFSSIYHLDDSESDFEWDKSEGVFQVEAGESLMSLSRNSTNAGFSGLEFAVGIPASIGGAVRMNAGAHGSEISSVVRSVKIITKEGELINLTNEQCGFNYRSSSIPADAIIVSTEFELSSGEKEEIISKRNSCLNYRKETQPLTLPSSGSVFKNPSTQIAAAELLEKSGLKGETRGGIAFSDMHANWLVRTAEGADSAAVAELIELAKSKVLEKFDIELQCEIKLWGF